MATSLLSRLDVISGEFKALATGHWMLFRQEMAGKVALTRQQTIFMAAGLITALTAILLILAGLTLLLSQVFVSQAGWEPLLSGGVSALIIAVVFALTGWLIFRRSGQKMKTEGLKPSQTIKSLKSAAYAFNNQPVIPTPPTTPMNSRKEFSNALNETADTVEYQAKRASRAVQDTAQSLSQKLDPGAFFAQALSWVDAVLTPQNRALAGKAFSAAALLPRRHPTLAALIGLGGVYLVWQKSRDTSTRKTVESYLGGAADYADDVRRTAQKGYKATAAAGRDLRGSLYDTTERLTETGRNAASQFGAAATQTAERVREAYEDARESVSEGVDHLAATTRQLRKDAEAGYHKAKDFAKEEPALAIAGGVALAIGALLLVKSSRR